ncbi:MAG TPA: putative toxin-antitoxin system toxin component, PIN family [Planctomycetaceae bacterium]|jgi:putative PIN family toxin of toxin-antitoxin system|nr:putative toxin-antitoxin system toxin component, PIN family [Planctomycetaceae bacterium]
MANELRVVIDTNVCISAVLLPRSVPRQAFDLAVQSGRLLVSAATVAELDEVLRRPKFDRYLLEEERLEFLAALVAEADWMEISTAITACRDPKDNKFLELAVSGLATHIITGDEDLLVMNPFEGIAVVRPQKFIQTFPGD